MPNSLIDRGPHIGQPLLFFCCWHEGSVLFMEQFCIVSSVPLLQYRFLVLLSTLGASTSSSCNSRGEHRDFWVWSSCLGDSGVQQAEAWFVWGFFFLFFWCPNCGKGLNDPKSTRIASGDAAWNCGPSEDGRPVFTLEKRCLHGCWGHGGQNGDQVRGPACCFFFTMCCQKGEIEDGALVRRKR